MCAGVVGAIVGVIWGDAGLWGVLIGFPLGMMLVAAILFLLVYEIGAYVVPFYLDTLRRLLSKVLPASWAKSSVEWLNARWRGAPAWMRDSPWMRSPRLPDSQDHE